MESWQMMYAQTYTTCQKFQVTRFASLPNNISLQLRTDVAQHTWTTLHGDFSCVTKANGLDYAYTSAERSAMIDRGILPLHIVYCFGDT